VRLSVGTWFEMTGFLLIGLIPFAALGIAIGHLVTSDAIGPAIGGITALMAFFGGAWFPIESGSVMHVVASGLPSYWLVQASRVGTGGDAWTATGWAVMAAWTLATVALARWAYRRDTAAA
jgi:ABC-2 type transport system permease protein